MPCGKRLSIIKENGLPSQPLDVSRRGMVFRNLQPSIIEDTDMKQIYDANVSARSPPKADGEISCRMKKSHGVVCGTDWASLVKKTALLMIKLLMLMLLIL
ncbi:unnamed protein product [Camellia sinensis]